ncbi:(-)-kolavenyl diphosphate synthase TPS28, chloroplastic-like [Mangifera indica]|uniref:(-)-kolavenyl diphosphate synthase TPS28, chloroplastic-like n=1 Tax=Mangifera indica TaxID=29780 RepID=UPI001CFAF848|nr:(-)-kolavenyl diphosphate synthase TPS28, chloroplastic-like [Mangifera indica]
MSNHRRFPKQTGFWPFGAKDKRVIFSSALSRPQIQDAFQVIDDIEEEDIEISLPNEIKEGVHAIRSMLGSMDDGEISISAYDTAWVALVEDVHNGAAPQFPSNLQWIANNQLPDGSWGEDKIFSAHDRLINTLACVVALKSWNIHDDKCQKGMKFFNENISKIENENDEHMLIGFEVAFPSILEMASSLGIEVPYDSPVLQKIYTKRNSKLSRIPRDIMHNMPTTLLHSLEGMSDLDWNKLLKLQCQDGSFLFSPSSTAYALMQTKDENCLKYLKRIVQKFNGGVPNVYPVDMFEHLWAVDRLQRLGISRYFQPEITQSLEYVYRYWTKEGICWARNSHVHDIDDTSMGFRLLRLHGFDVSADVFKHFEKGNEFFCFAGQSNQAVTGIYNLYRASQIMFPGEKILDNAKQFSVKFLREKQAANQLVDKWVITKDLPGEVGFALDVPWYASLPRIETRLFIEQYGGEDDIWIGKTLYRMPCVNNDIYLQLAKLDYNNCQAVHLREWDSMNKWYSEYKLQKFGISVGRLLLAYFVASASIFEPERWQERIAWAKTAFLMVMISSYFDNRNNSDKLRRTFVNQFRNYINPQNHININGRRLESDKIGLGLIRTLLGTLNQISLDALLTQGRDYSRHLRQAWEKWLMKWEAEGDRHQGEAELIIQTINLTAGRWISEELLSYSQYRLTHLTNTICHKLAHFQDQKVNDNADSVGGIASLQIESDMQELVQIVLQNSSNDINSDIKRTFLTVAKSFYYSAYCDRETIRSHIDTVLFQRAY